MEAYEETYPESLEISRARFSLEDQCMRGFGLSVDLGGDSAGSAISYDASNMARRYGLSDPAAAEVEGYAVSGVATSPPSESPLSAAERFVLTGTNGSAPANTAGPSPQATYEGRKLPAGGCAGQAARTTGVLPSNLLADQLDAQSLDASQTDPAVVAATSKWSECMKQDGYSVASPYDASALSARAGAQPGSTLDRTIAVDDVRCKQSTDLIGIWFRIETRIQNQYISANAQVLSQQRANLSAIVKNASAITTH